MSKQYPGGLITKTPVTPSGPYETDSASGIWTLDQQMAYTKQGIWPTAGRLPPDPQFNYVTMLLHGDGTNGAQNNTFLDSSTNNFTITRNGNTTQGSFSPYGSNWSNYFDGSGDYLSVPDNSALEGFTNFTFECWLYVSDFASGDIVFAKGFGPGFCPYMFYFTSTDLVFYASSSLSSWDVADSQVIVSNIVKNQWYHVAASRSGSSIKLFANGAVTTSLTNGSTLGANASTFNVASAVDGTRNPEIYISNLRINNTALYTAAFTPSTTPLTAVTGTSLLTCQSNRFIDNSANAFSISTSGTPSVQRFNPFGTSTAYSTSVIGGSGYFDGSGDYLTIPTNTAFAFGTGDFTVEAWIFNTGTTANYAQIFGSSTYGGASEFLLSFQASTKTIYVQVFNNGLTSTNTVLSNSWSHIALVRSSSVITIYINGVASGSKSDTSNVNSTITPTIGASNNDNADSRFMGYISNVRVVKGTAVYTSSFTPPTAPLTAISGTSLLTNYTNGAIYDNAMMNELETVGNAQISTSVVKYGTGSLYFDGTGDSLSVLNTRTSTPWGTESWTIEGWIYPTAVSSTYRTIYANGFPVQIFQTGGSVEIYISSTNSYDYIVNGLTGPASSVSANTWTHFAVVKNGNVYTVYVNGVGGSTVTSSTAVAYTSTVNAVIGDAPFGSYPYVGYIDDLRITKGYARYTSNFTPPTAAFPNIGPN